jgi:hypothetical protein
LAWYSATSARRSSSGMSMRPAVAATTPIEVSAETVTPVISVGSARMAAIRRARRVAWR